MLFVYSGTDFVKRNRSAAKLLDVLTTKRPDAEMRFFDDENFSDTTIPELLGTVGLFEEKTITKLSGVTANKDWVKIIEKNIKDLHESNNAFVLVEEKIPASLKKKIESVGVEIKYFDLPKPANTGLNAFAIADAVLQKRNDAAWKTYQELKLSGSADEELLGIIWWQLKSLLLSFNYSQPESGLKPFVYNKCKSVHRNWSKEEVEKKLESIIILYHESRRGNQDLGVSVEQFILNHL